MSMRYILWSLFFVQLAWTANAQVSNDECEGAIEITNLSGCSAAGAFSNQGAITSGLGEPDCFDNVESDVWYVFTPTATDVTVTVVGNTPLGAGGTLRRPEIGMYLTDDCMSFNQTQCESDNNASHIVELYKGGLEIGRPIYLRIQGADGNEGTFQMCVDNYNPPVLPGSDCVTSSVLCDKSTFVVQQVIGAGNDPDEAAETSCLGQFFGNTESNSTWFTWTAATSGTLEFTLTPLNAPDDLDFVVFELPNGVEDCSGKTELRCMAAGDSTFPSPCMGPTGLRESSTDFSESAGCETDLPKDNYVAALDMIEGTSYALMINNFSGTGNGFRMDFGGTGEFLGPQANFLTDVADQTACIGQTITYTDASTFSLGDIVNWEWNFGADASPATASGQGPHTVTYNTPGVKSTLLTVESDKGCRVSEVGAPIIIECCDINLDINADISDVVCPSDQNGAIDLTVMNDFPPYGFQWTTGASTEDINNLMAGEYTVTITDEATCDTVVTFMVNSPPPIEFNPMITKPTCDGGTDGAITLQTQGGTPPYEFDFGLGFSTDNTLANIPQGDYTVVIRDANNCEETMTIEVRELELMLDPSIQAIIPPACFGDSNASITVQIGNGLPPYEYNFNDGTGFSSDNQRTGLSSGTFIVDVRDANLCEGQFELVIEDPAELILEAEKSDISCFGEEDGRAVANVSGGTPNYTYSWSSDSSKPVIEDLTEGTYIVTVQDQNGCIAVDSVTIIEPNRLDAGIIEAVDALCFGESSGRIVAEGIGGSPPFTYSLDGFLFQESPELTGLPKGEYTVTVKDSRECTATITTSIDEPVQLLVDLGPDQSVNLGETLILDPQIAPPNAMIDYTFSGTDSLSCLDCPNPEAYPLGGNIFYVTITDESGCTASDNINVTVAKPRPIYIPTAFSPNGDGINDFFFIYGDNSARKILSFRIFDRWGELMYEGIDLDLGNDTLGWDGVFRGKNMTPAVFVYIAEIEFIDGQVFTYDGDVAIIR